MESEESAGSPLRVEPILAVKDVTETVLYWHDVLGFPDKWTWGEPPNHGGVSWNGVAIQFSQDFNLAAVSTGNAIFFRTKKLEALYDFHQKKNAEITEPLENKPWGMAGYTVRDINGYYIIFAGTPISERKENSAALPSTINIIARLPSVKEYQYLAFSVGWSAFLNDDVAKKLLTAPLFAVVAEDTASNQVIGCALVLGDHASFYYIKDVIVHPAWQHKHVGTAMMKEVSQWLEKNAATNALVGLITGESLAPFYQQFGFAPAFSMVHYIQRDEK
jgi:GNAT superfamily N-acetyltransferase/uncharacterized glyoxalase superfamily protein PhnB